jgi:hypothetical protein
MCSGQQVHREVVGNNVKLRLSVTSIEDYLFLGELQMSISGIRDKRQS